MILMRNFSLKISVQKAFVKQDLKYNITRKSSASLHFFVYYINYKFAYRCGAISVKGCKEIERDLTLPYPKCCQHFKCADGTSLKDY